MKQLRYNLGHIILFILALIFAHSMAWSNDQSIHKNFNNVLQIHIIDGHVNYTGILNDPKFAQYIEDLEQEQKFNNSEEELSYWINAYNALAIKGILDGRSPSTLFGRFGYFKKAKYQVNGKKVNLYDLERKIIIPLGEPRIHFAINCASQSCPKLLSMIYSAETLEGQLETSTRTFINDPTRNRFDREKKVAYVSKIFDWFEQDFSQHSGSVQKYLARYVEEPELAKELENEQYKIKYMKYDWNLNGTPPNAS